MISFLTRSVHAEVMAGSEEAVPFEYASVIVLYSNDAFLFQLATTLLRR